ncbi:MAG: hypothetical protein A2W00_02280 [Candidatus Eisenbacteria bacterium RBG_16_71_46]|nr:MAG: hypothetical protein A2W00_02280 [Candidatus Eisenbacteria bacterium RBG_16_71_46]
MRLSFGIRTLLSASMVGLALVVSMVALGIQTGLALRSTIAAAAARSLALAQESAVLSGRAASAAGHGRGEAAVAADRVLAALFESALASDPTIIDLGVYDTRGHVLTHSMPARVGDALPHRPPLGGLVEGGLVRQALRLLGPAQVYEQTVPLRAGDRDFGEVRVGVSSALLRAQLLESLRAGLWTSLVALLLAIAMALAFAQLLSRRMRNVVTGLERLREGEFGYRTSVEGRDELARLASSINALGERLQSARARVAIGEAAPGELLDATSRVAAWAKMASGLAHEMADPLNAAALHLGHLKRKWLAPTPEAADHLRVLENELKRLEQIVVGFRPFSMLGELKTTWFDPRTLLADVAERARATLQPRRIEVRLDFGDLPERFWGDPALLSQALSNLIANAEQAMPGGGVIDVEAMFHDGHLEITVCDEGIGIPEELQTMIFDLYFTTRPGGSGIGLAVVQHVAQLHGGRVQLRSTRGEGTRITLMLPARKLEALGVA